MNFLFEFIVEFIMELVLDGAIDSVENDALSKKVRIGLAIFISLIYIAFSCLFIFFIVQNDNFVLRILFSCLILFLTFFLGHMWYKIIKKK